MEEGRKEGDAGRTDGRADGRTDGRKEILHLRIADTITARTPRNSSRFMFLRTLESSWERMRKAVAAWWFSRTLLSL
jgi:hypothetical protein